MVHTMKRSFLNRRLIMTLMLVMLVDGSFALELLTHAPAPAAVATADHAHMHGMAYDMNHQADQAAPQSEISAHVEDCVCDEICCVSSVNLLASNSGLIQNQTDDPSGWLPALYQSVFLDMVLPPPTS